MISACLPITLVTALSLVTVCCVTFAQTTCTSGYRIVGRHYDAELRQTWEVRQDCAHSAWPAKAVAVANSPLLPGSAASFPPAIVPYFQPLLVRAGERVRLWSQDGTSRIEITGIAEQSKAGCCTNLVSFKFSVFRRHATSQTYGCRAAV